MININLLKNLIQSLLVLLRSHILDQKRPCGLL